MSIEFEKVDRKRWRFREDLEKKFARGIMIDLFEELCTYVYTLVVIMVVVDFIVSPARWPREGSTLLR